MLLRKPHLRGAKPINISFKIPHSKVEGVRGVKCVPPSHDHLPLGGLSVDRETPQRAI